LAAFTAFENDHHHGHQMGWLLSAMELNSDLHFTPTSCFFTFKHPGFAAFLPFSLVNSIIIMHPNSFSQLTSTIQNRMTSNLDYPLFFRLQMASRVKNRAGKVD
jgi:hypothetical protein